MEKFDVTLLKQLYIPPEGSHKGENGKLLLIGGSHLFHASALWALEIASKIVDMVFFASVLENNQIVLDAKKEFRNGIVIPQRDIEHYINEADVILIGPGMIRNSESRAQNAEFKKDFAEIINLSDEGEKTYWLTKYLLRKYPRKKWVIDAGALQMLDVSDLAQLNGNVILTPHHQEFEGLKSSIQHTAFRNKTENIEIPNQIAAFAKDYNCIVVLKGEKDVVCSPAKCLEISGGNAGMTKGGTGDVLAGLIAALACTNDLFLSAATGAYINKRAGERLFARVGYYFNASDLLQEIPILLHDFMQHVVVS